LADKWIDSAGGDAHPIFDAVARSDGDSGAGLEPRQDFDLRFPAMPHDDRDEARDAVVDTEAAHSSA
jgi:hypothetical protein